MTESSVNRGSSRVSDATGGASLQVKKARAAPAARKEPAARTQKDPAKKAAPARPAPPKRASTSAVVKGKAKVNDTAKPTSSAAAQKPSIKVFASDEQGDSGNGLDMITAGMNKVKITLVNNSGREMDEGTQAVPEPALNTAAPRPRIKIVSRNASPDRPKTSDGVQSTQPDDIRSQGADHSPVLSITTPIDAPPPADSPDLRSLGLSSSSPEQPAPGTPDIFVPYQPDGPTPGGLPVNDVQFLPPNMATPTPMKRTDLPKFTPTSAIPFATREEGPKGEVLEEEDESCVWDVPKTPLKSSGL